MTTRKSVVLGERIASGIITVGGLMVIFAVLGIMVFLFRVVMPLMAGGEMHGSVRYQLATQEPVVWINSDEFQTLAVMLDESGTAITWHVPTGTEISRTSLDFDGARVTAASGTLERDRVALGFDDGSVRFLTLGFSASATAQGRLPSDLVTLDARDRVSGERVFTEVGTGDFRTLSSIVEVRSAEEVSTQPIVALDYRIGGTVERPTIIVFNGGCGRAGAGQPLARAGQYDDRGRNRHHNHH
jgi:phosphate transport system permease protein